MFFGTGTAGPSRQGINLHPVSENTLPSEAASSARAAAATTVYVILRVVDNLKTILAPILPHTAQKLHELLGYEGQLFGTQHVVEYQEEARLGRVRSHAALTYDHSAAIGTWTSSALSLLG
jgi:methionyl-tRNA synthetase